MPTGMSVAVLALFAGTTSALLRRERAQLQGERNVTDITNTTAQSWGLNTTSSLMKYSALGSQELPPIVHGSKNGSLQFSGKSSSSRRPRVHFLFLAVDMVSNLDIWTAFFKNAPKDQFRAYVHCKNPACESQVRGSPLEAIPAVPSYYCTDLVSPMQQLVRQAIAKETDANPYDKFAFISDSSLPAKPFKELYSSLTAEKGSDFCVFPASEWADLQDASGQMRLVPKVHQWVTLDREHAEKSLKLWDRGYKHSFMNEFGMNHHSFIWSNNSFGDQRNFGCLDEFWYFYALFGAVSHPGKNQVAEQKLDGFRGGPLRVDEKAAWQGKCDTFVIWSKYMNAGRSNPFERMHLALDHQSIPHNGNFARPGWWDKMTRDGMKAIRNSDFLFVRKFINQPQLVYGRDGESFAHAYEDVVLN